MLDLIKKLDSYPKAFDDFRVKTNTGALMSLMSVLLMVILFFSELSYLYKTETVDHLFVNNTRTAKLTVDFDLSFPEISCNLLSLDAFDDAGNPQLDAISEIYKMRLSTSGVKEGFPEIQELGQTMRDEEDLEKLAREHVTQQVKVTKDHIGSCGNCYGAGTPGQCCNTCQDVKDAYARIGWQFKSQGIIQCSSEAFIKNMNDQFAEDGGCQVYGRLTLNRGSGHFHIAPHKKLHKGGAAGAQAGLFNLMDLISFTFDQFNITHTINSLSFGDNFPGIKSPLDLQQRKIEDTHGMYQYYLKVVPTKYKHFGGEEIQSNQYSVTEHVSHLAPGSGRGLPGVYFHYEVSPIQAVFEEKRGHLLSFITSVCAIIGGVYIVMGLLEGFVSGILKMFYKDHL